MTCSVQMDAIMFVCFPSGTGQPCFSAFLEVGILCLDWAGPGWVVEGNRQLEMGANVECEELGCVVGGPFKPNKLREVRGLVWRPWINKPSEMTMRCADICHHTTLSSKHKPPNPSLPLSCPVSHMFDLPPSPLFHFITHTPHFLPHTSCILYFICYSSLTPPYSFLHLMSSQWLHPSLRSSMHAWLAVSLRFCLCYRQSYGTALALSRRTTAETPELSSGPQSLFIEGRGSETAHNCISSLPLKRTK